MLRSPAVVKFNWSSCQPPAAVNGTVTYIEPLGELSSFGPFTAPSQIFDEVAAKPAPVPSGMGGTADVSNVS